MENCKLPRDLVIDILARLPVKSLMRYMCVCKFFYDLIKRDHHFMNKHYGISKAKTDYVLLEVGFLLREYYLLYKEPERDEIGCIFLDIPRTPATRCVKCCQGTLCLISSRNDVTRLRKGFRKGVDYLIYDILIWNPSIKKIKALPSVTVPYKLPDYPLVFDTFGFGISNNMTWKVVMLLRFDVSDGESGKNVHQITMVCSQVTRDSWSSRQINAVPPLSHNFDGDDFYFKGRYYWCTFIHYHQGKPSKQQLLCFDMDDEVFNTIELPSNVCITTVTILDESIALLGYPSLRDFSCIEIWLMTENDNNISWHKQVSIDCVVNIDNNERWKPIGIWNVDSSLLVFPDNQIDCDLCLVKRDVPYFVSLDLVTQKRKMFCISQKRKSIKIASNSAGYFQVFNERNTNITKEWKRQIFMRTDIYARVYTESLHLM